MEWPIHAKDVEVITLEEMDKLAKESTSALQDDWELAKRFLNDPTMYSNTRALPDDRHRAFSALSDSDMEKLYSLGHWKPFSGTPLGYTHVFLVPEPWKNRWRVISHTLSVNRDEADNVPPVHLPSLNDVRASVFKGSYAACVDMAQCFCQFELGEKVRPYFVIATKHGYASLGRLAMGQRQSCFIAQTALTLILGNPVPGVHKLGYIDNGKFTGEKDAIVAELEVMKNNAKRVNATFTEFMNDRPLDELVSNIVEYLGLRLDHSTKKVQLTQKVLEKLKLSLLSYTSWSVRQWSNHVSILLYTYFALRYKLGEHEEILKTWARVQSEAYANESLWEQPASGLPDLTRWTNERLDNEWIEVKVETKPSFTLITDASSTGWCGILISNKSGEYTIAYGKWTRFDGLSKEELRQSSMTEPLGIYKAAKTLIYDGSRITVDLVGDNMGTVKIINKGFSTRSKYSVMQQLQRDYKTVEFVAHHIAGTDNPADGPSRGSALNTQQLERAAESLNLPAIRAKEGNESKRTSEEKF